MRKAGMFVTQQYAPPEYGNKTFSCPNCTGHTQQDWYEMEYHRAHTEVSFSKGLTRLPPRVVVSQVPVIHRTEDLDFKTNDTAALSKCCACGEIGFWLEGKLVYPMTTLAPIANQDMPQDVMDIYNEAREVSAISPMAAAALLRLALEKLLPQVGAQKDSIDKMIGQLVGNGLPSAIQKALDSLRVIGNEAVHAGTIDLRDNHEIAAALFKMLNFVVDRMITQKREIDEIYDLLPQTKLDGIANRDKNAPTNG